MRSAGNDEGFTLIELLVACAILLLVIGSAYSVLNSATSTEEGQRVRAEALDEMRSGMNRLTKELRQAVSVSVAGSDASVLDMQTLIGGVQHHVVYEVSGGVLRRKVGDGSSVPLVRAVAPGQVFCYDPPICVAPQPEASRPSILRLTLRVQPSGTEVIEFSSDVNLRNSGS